jgi:very-short-patch-repair endonuclease
MNDFEPFGSPIEVELAWGIYTLGAMRIVPKFKLTYEQVRVEAPKLLGPRDQLGLERAVVFPQVQIAKYFADFLVMFWDDRNLIIPIAIECDGHDFHERTPQQAAYDRRRDRFFASNSIFVMRFTGREIKRDPVECAREVLWASTYIAHGPSAKIRGETWLLSEEELAARDEEHYEEDARHQAEIEAFKQDLIEEEIMSGTYEGYWP